MDLRSFPRPANDNSTGIHMPQTQFFGDDLALWLGRVKAMNMSWVTTLQTDEGFFRECAARNLGVVCRPFIRANHEYGDDGSCVEHMIAAGVTPYVQIYNEPDLLGTEWEGEVPGDYDWAMRTWASRWIAAARYVSGRGGYPGIQTLDVDWYRHLLTRLMAEDPALLEKTWFSSHNYCSNHGPNYPYNVGQTIYQDWFAILSPLKFNQIAVDVIGRPLPTICTEGGYAIGDAADNRWGPITPEQHRDFTLEMFDMFRTGVLPNGEPLPDWWFGVTPWLLASVAVGGDSAFENNAWYSAWFGERTLTIEACKARAPYIRQFSWDAGPLPDPQPEPTPQPEPGGPTVPEYHFGFKTLHDANPTAIGNATSEQIDVPNVCSLQFTEKGIMFYQGSAGVKFIAQTLPKV